MLKGGQQPIPIVKLLFALPSPLFLIPLSIAIGANVISIVKLVAETLPLIFIILGHIALVTSSISFSWLMHDGTRILPACAACSAVLILVAPGACRPPHNGPRVLVFPLATRLHRPSVFVHVHPDLAGALAAAFVGSQNGRPTKPSPI